METILFLLFFYFVFCYFDKHKKVEEVKQETIESNSFAPTTFEEYIGQPRAKDLLINYLDGVDKRGDTFPHLLIYGPAGTGKTTLGRILTRYIGMNFGEIIASSIESAEHFVQLVEKVDGGCIIIDEVHSVSRQFAEQIYTIMQDFSYNGRPLKPFTLIGCTTEYGEMVERYLPFVDRFRVQIELEDYEIKDLIDIGKQYYEANFSDTPIEDEVFEKIALNCRRTPRRVLSYLTSTVYLGGNVDKALKNFSIVKNGYTTKDIKVLEYLKESGTTGLQAISAYLGTSRKNYEQIESYLLKNFLIARTSRGRKITDRGEKLLLSLTRGT